jgi:hypothetical protein
MLIPSMNDETIVEDVVIETSDVQDVDAKDVEIEELRAKLAEKEESERNRKAAERRVAQKQQLNKSNLIDPELVETIAELKFDRKVARFAEDNGLTKTQAEKVLKFKPDATAEDLNDEFIKAGIEALNRASKRENVERNIPKGKNTVSTPPKKSLSEMTAAEKQAWFESR